MPKTSRLFPINSQKIPMIPSKSPIQIPIIPYKIPNSNSDQSVKKIPNSNPNISTKSLKRPVLPSPDAKRLLLSSCVLFESLQDVIVSTPAVVASGSQLLVTWVKQLTNKPTNQWLTGWLMVSKRA